MQAFRLIRGRLDPDSRTPDAYVDTRLRSVEATAVLATPDDHGIRRRKQVIPAPRLGLEAPQGRARGLLKRLVRGPGLVRSGLCLRQFLDHSPEPSDASPASRGGLRHLVVIAAADKLKPALRAGSRTGLVLPHRAAPDAARDYQAIRLLHIVNIGRRPGPNFLAAATVRASGIPATTPRRHPGHQRVSPPGPSTLGRAGPGSACSGSARCRSGRGRGRPSVRRVRRPG